MAINTVAVVGPRAEQREEKAEKKDPLDMILKGLQLAQGITGVAVNYQTIKQKMADNRVASDQAKAIHGDDKRMGLAKDGMQEVPLGTKGAQEFAFRTGEGDEDVTKRAFILPQKQTERSPLIESVSNYTDPKSGQKGTAFVDKTTGAVTGFTPQGSPDPTFSVTVDRDGNAWKVNNRTGEMTPAQTGDAKFGKVGKGATGGTLEAKLKGLNSSERQRYDSAAMGLNAVDDMATALIDQNENTFSLVGDNNYTVASREFKEAIGRMQSGGVIGVDEGKDFLKMAPGPLDDAETQKTKLERLKAEMASRLQTLGFDADEVRASRKAIAEKNKIPGKPESGTAIAGPKIKVGHEEDGYRFKGGDPADKSNWEKVK